MDSKLPLLFVTAISLAWTQPQPPTGLRTEYLVNPEVVDVARPRFSWVLEHTERGQRQTAWQILVSTRPEVNVGDVWDSGRVEGAQSTHVTYNGKPLESGRTYYWKVRWWDAAGQASPYSRPARFTMGLLNPSDWKGRWIGGANQLRKEFNLAARPVRARAFISGLGYYELRINGRKVGDHVLDPGWTTYDKRVLYTSYDVTDLLRQGANAVGIILGQGWYGARAALLQLNIEMEGGQRTEVVTDASWKVRQGPILSDSIYDGETYDARLETPGWDRPGFVDVGWQAATLVDPPKGQLSAQMMPPIRVTDTIVPLRMWSPRPGVYVFDMGQNFAGWCQLRVRGPRGTAVRLRHAELVYDNGMINVENIRRARATDTYILRGDGDEEIWEPRFTYHGFRYVEVTGYPGTPRLDSIRGRVVHTDVKPHGNFVASKQILNRIQHLILWGIRSNLHSVPTDCNQRDERMGWMADAHLYTEPTLWNYDSAAFYANFLRNIRDIQGPDGSVTDTVPHKYGRRPADPAWGAAYPLITWYLYLYHGDRRVLEEHFEGIKAWTDFQRSQAKDGILSYSYYGDWVPIERTPGELVSTFYYYYSAHLTSRMAQILGRKTEAEAYAKLADEIRDAFNKRFLNPDGTYANRTQTAHTLALYLDLVPKERRGAVSSYLRDDIIYRNNTHLTTGIIGTKYIMELLTRQGQTHLAYDLATQTTYPSWGYMVENGATTLWELWQNKTGPGMNSHNHPMFGSVGAWFYKALAGIDLDPERPGFERIRIVPGAVRDLDWVSGDTETLRGRVLSQWSRTPESFRLEVIIPVGSTAEVHLPKLNNWQEVEVTESGRTVWKGDQFATGVPGISAGRQTRDEIILEVGSGRYLFEVRGK
jgi:alpha-L-rhamnosidase